MFVGFNLYRHMRLTTLVAQAVDACLTFNHIGAVVTNAMTHGVAFVLEGIFQGFLGVARCFRVSSINVFDQIWQVEPKNYFAFGRYSLKRIAFLDWL